MADLASIWSVALARAAITDYAFFNFRVVPSYAVGTLTPHREAMRMFFGGLQVVGRNPPIIRRFGDPHQRQHCHTAPMCLCTFGDTREALELVVQAWGGGTPVRGRMPVAFLGISRRGDGVDLVP